MTRYARLQLTRIASAAISVACMIDIFCYMCDHRSTLLWLLIEGLVLVISAGVFCEENRKARLLLLRQRTTRVLRDLNHTSHE